MYKNKRAAGQQVVEQQNALVATKTTGGARCVGSLGTAAFCFVLQTTSSIPKELNISHLQQQNKAMLTQTAKQWDTIPSAMLSRSSGHLVPAPVHEKTLPLPPPTPLTQTVHGLGAPSPLPRYLGD